MDKEKLIKMGISEETAEAILKEFSNEVGKITEERDTAVTKSETLEKQLSEANETIAGFGDIKPGEFQQKVKDWEEKYNKDTGELKKQLEEREITYQTEKFMSGYKFTSDLAKTAATSAFREKGFKLEDGKFLGGEEFMEELKKNNPSAFESAEGTPKVVIGGENAGKSIDTAQIRAIMGLPAEDK